MYDWTSILTRLSMKDEIDIDFADLDLFRTAPISTAVFARTRWPGIHPTSVENPDPASTFGRWHVEHDSLVCDGNGYYILAHDIESMDWIAHLTEKNWLYDPTDFLDALQAGLALFGRDGIIDDPGQQLRAQIDDALARAEPVFLPSQAQGWFAYMPHKMDIDEIRGFAEFLDSNGFQPSV